MLRKIVLLAIILLPLGVFAQDQVKIGHVNSQEIFNAMPETAAAEKELNELIESYHKELKTMEDEYNKKYTEFMQQSDSLAQSIRVRRMQEVTDLRDRTETFYQQGQQEIAKKREELNLPIVQKIQDAIKAVGEEQGFTHMMEMGAFLYVSSKAIDATPMVKTKLGLK